MASALRRVPDTERNVNSSLYFGNLDPQVSEILMYELFIQFAPVRSLNMPKDRILKTHQGFGFVEFKTIEDAEYTLDILRGVRLYGKTLKIRKSEPQKTTQTTGPHEELIDSNYMDVGARLFVRNLNPLIDEQFLRETFSKFGTLIKPPSIQRDPETGESEGYGFLTYDDFTTSDTVIEKMNGATLMNLKVTVAYAFKEHGHQKGASHGDKVERLLAENARKNNVLVGKKKRKPGKVQKPKHKKHEHR